MVSEDFESLLARGQSMLETLFPGVLVVGGDAVECANNGARMGSALEEGGFVESGTRAVRVTKEALPLPPAIGEVVELDGVEVRCVGISERQWDVAWHLELEPVRA